MIVVDASALVEWVLRSRAGLAAGQHLTENHGRTHVPAFAVVEAAQALRRLEASGSIDAVRADRSFDAISSLRLSRHDPTHLLRRVWALRLSMSAYDAVYVALAEALGAQLVTCDARLGRSRGHTAEIVTLTQGR